MVDQPAVSMRELELESAELLPGRETMFVIKWQLSHGDHGDGCGGGDHGDDGGDDDGGDGCGDDDGDE